MDAITRFAELVDRPSEQVDLALAALAFAAAADPDLDEQAWLSELDRLAAGVTDFESLRQRLFITEGFTGATEQYYGAESSMLHRVLESRRGIPISLSLVAIEVGRRAGVAVEGIGAPGHFLIRDPVSGMYCDPFNGGDLLEEDEIPALLASVGAGGELRPHLPVLTTHEILTRMLTNLVHIYRRSGRADDLEWALRCQRAIPGIRVDAALHLGESLASKGRFLEAAQELEATALQTDAADAQRLLTAARAVRARLN
jgi:regulator of sirC expression with transglutaminase-like and TPR domain